MKINQSFFYIYTKLLLTAIFWGGTFIAGRVIAENGNPYSAAFLRFIIASVFLILLSSKLKGSKALTKPKQILLVSLLGLTGVFLYNVFFFKGLHIIKASQASIIIAMNPIFISLFSLYFFKEKLSLPKTMGIIISVSGAIIVISKGNLSGFWNGDFGLGELYIFGCVLCWVSYSLIGKKVMLELNPLIAVTYSSVIGTMALAVPAYYEGIVIHVQNYSIMEWLSLFYLGFFGTVLGFVWYYQGIKKLGPTKAGIFINFVPISAIVLAFCILDESITLLLVIGTVLVSVGVYLTNRKTIQTHISCGNKSE